MRTLTPFSWSPTAQDDTSGATAQESTAAEPVTVSEPFITGADTALWVGFGAFITVFVLVLIAIIRSRVIKPAERKARASTFFEPAGADAEITFEESAAEEANAKKGKKAKKKKKRREEAELVDADAVDATQGQAETEVIVSPVEEEPEKKKSRAPFANLFSGRKSERDAADTVEDVVIEEPDDFAEVTIEQTAQEAGEHLVDDDLWTAEHEEQEEQQRAEMEREAERRAELEREAQQRAALEKADQERRFALEEAARAREEARKQQSDEADREQAEREAAFERRKAEAALEQRMQSLATMQRKLDEKSDRLTSDTQAIHHRIGADLDQKFSSLSDALYDKLNGAASNLAKISADLQPSSASPDQGGGAEIRALSEDMEGLKKATEAAFAKLNERIDTLSSAQASMSGGFGDIKRLNELLAERAAPAAAGALQLSELVRSALPADRCKLDAQLKNGATADCLISGHGAAPPFAVDARFPVEAYEQYARASGEDRRHVETLYRRAVLRHMVFIAEKLVAPEETADFAVMFLPNDTIFNDLHANFADIIQDSYRARIWIASPTSLMATLHMMGAAAARFAADQKANATAADKALRDDVSALMQRLERLEQDVAAGTAAAKSVPESSTAIVTETAAHDGEAADEHSEEPDGSTPAATDEEEAEVQIIKSSVGQSAERAKPPAENDERPPATERPPFPLR